MGRGMSLPSRLSWASKTAAVLSGVNSDGSVAPSKAATKNQPGIRRCCGGWAIGAACRVRAIVINNDRVASCYCDAGMVGRGGRSFAVIRRSRIFAFAVLARCFMSTCFTRAFIAGGAACRVEPPHWRMGCLPL